MKQFESTKQTQLNLFEGDNNSAPAIVNALPAIMSSAGFLWGLGYSFSHKKGFWAYVGYSFLGSIAGVTAGSLIKVIAYPKTAASFSGAEGKIKVKTFKPKAGCVEREGEGECCKPFRWKFASGLDKYVCVK